MGLLAWGNVPRGRGGDRRQCSTNHHPDDGGVDLHARSRYVCLVNHAGELLVHRHMTAAPEPVLNAVAPDRDGGVVAVECLFTWDWPADLCAHEGIPFVLGHALSLQAIHRGKGTPYTLDPPQIAAQRRGGMRPQA